jgi:hypothetical protein
VNLYFSKIKNKSEKRKERKKKEDIPVTGTPTPQAEHATLYMWCSVGIISFGFPVSPTSSGNGAGRKFSKGKKLERHVYAR